MSQKLAQASGGQVFLWDMTRASSIRVRRRKAAAEAALDVSTVAVHALAWNHNNQVLASVGSDGYIALSHQTGAFLEALPCPATNAEELFAVVFSSSSRQLAVGGTQRRVTLWDLSKKSAKSFEGHTNTVTSISFSLNDTYLASGSATGDILVHDVKTGNALGPFRGADGVKQLRFSPFHRSMLAAVYDNGALMIWDISAGHSTAQFLHAHTAPCSGCAFSPFNRLLLATVGLDKRIHFFDLEKKEVVKTIECDTPLSSVAFMDDGMTVAAGTLLGQVLVFDLRGPCASPERVFAAGPARPVESLAFQTKGRSKSAAASASDSTATDRRVPTSSSVHTTSTADRRAPTSSSVHTASTADRRAPTSSTVSLTSTADRRAPTSSSVHAASTADRRAPTSSSVHAASTADRRAPTSSSVHAASTADRRAPTSSSVHAASTADRRAPTSSSVHAASTVDRRAPTSSTVPLTSVADRRVPNSNSSVSSRDNALPPATTNTPPARVALTTTTANPNSSPPTPPSPAKSSQVAFPSPSTALPPALAESFSPQQQSQIRQLVTECLMDVRESFHRELSALHVELLRQFHLHKIDMDESLRLHSVNSDLLNEVSRLRDENERLRSNF